MRYLVTLFGFVGLIVGFIAWANARQPHEYTHAIAAIQLGGIVLAIGMVSSDIVAAIKRGPDRRSDQPPHGAQGKTSTAPE